MSKITLADFVTTVNEAGRPKKIKGDDGRDIYVEPGQPNPDNIVGKDEDHNGSNGLFAIDPPTDDDLNWEIKKEELNKNMKRLMMKLSADEPFFIMGEAGWGKTSIIEKLAKRFGKTIITVYLDKAAKEDLGGIPVPVPGKNGIAKQQLAVPAWAAYIIEHPDTDFLLFFDEMNQAAPDVMNALMPIVLKRELCGYQPGPKGPDGKRIKPNFTVGAAGNFEHENDAVSELSGPLKSRFKPIIVWNTSSEEDWKSAFKHLHNVWDSKLDPELVNMFEDNAMLFENPREIDHKIFTFIERIKNSDKRDFYEPEDYLERLEALVKPDLTRSQSDKLVHLADTVYKYIIGDESWNPKAKSKSRRGQDMIPDTLKQSILDGMTKGYIDQDEDGKRVKYGISRENISILCDPELYVVEEDNDPINAEMLQRLIDKFEADGYKFKFNTNKEFLAKGYKDPYED